MLINLTKNPFAKIQKGHQVFYNFCFEHYTYLGSNNDNAQLTNFIDELKLVLEPYNNWIKSQDKEVIDKKEDTDIVIEIINAFKKYVKEDLFIDVNYHFVNEPHKIQELYPHGINEYNKITRTNAETLMDRVANFCKTNIANLDKDRDKDTKKFLEDYIANRTSQVKGKGNVKEGSTVGKALRKAVENQMHYTMIDLMGLHKKDLNQLLKYYNPSILKTRRKRNSYPKIKLTPPSEI